MNRIYIIATIFPFLFCSFIQVQAQNREPQNIYRVTVNSRYVLEDGKRTSKFFAIGQQISDSLGRLHTEIDYDWETRRPDNYRWHYFDGQKKVKTDLFVSSQLARINKYTYNDDGNLDELVIYNVTQSDTAFVVQEVYSYTDGLLTNVVGYNERGRRGFRARYRYDANGNEISRRVRGQRAVPSDSIMALERTLVYDSLGRIVRESKTLTKLGEPEQTSIMEYKYNDRGLLAEKSVFSSQNELHKRIEYNYRRDNRIQQKIVYDGDDNLIDYLAWRYEIYRTPDRRHRVLE